MSTSVYLCDRKRRLAFELGGWRSMEDFPAEAVITVDEALKALKPRTHLSREDLLSLAGHVHEFAKAADFDVEVRMWHELPEGWAYEGGAWNLPDAVARFSRRVG